MPLPSKRLSESEQLDVVRDIAPGDVMYASDPQGYFERGPRALRRIREALAIAGAANAPARILDLPCGHGRVLRTLRAAWPDAHITACDLLRDGVDFCARTFDAVPVYSTEDPRAIELEGGYDLIWCGSLLTHVGEPSWDGFLDLFERSLATGGLLVFTVHGRRLARLLHEGRRRFPGLGDDRTRALLEAFEADRFGYQQRQGEDTGISLSAPSWVCEKLETRTELALLTYTEAGWGAQDCVACARGKSRG